MPQHLALNTITIKQEADLKRKIEIAAAAGFTGIGLWSSELTDHENAGGELSQVRGWLDEAGLVVPEMCFVGGWMFVDDQQKQTALAQCRRQFQQARAVGCGCVIACASGAEGPLDEAAADYAELCDAAADYDVVPALEFLAGAQTVRTLTSAAEVVARADRPNGGILLDTFHFIVGGSQLRDIAEAGKMVAMVHINDCPGKPDRTDADRVHAGDGDFPLREMLDLLGEVGYEGFLSLELFNPGYWAQPAAGVAREGCDKLRNLVSA